MRLAVKWLSDGGGFLVDSGAAGSCRSSGAKEGSLPPQAPGAATLDPVLLCTGFRGPRTLTVTLSKRQINAIVCLGVNIAGCSGEEGA